MKKNMLGIPVLILVTVILVVMVSIFIPDKTQKEQENGDVNLYYISAEGYTLEQIPYQFSSKGNTLTMANEILEQLKKVPDNTNVQPSIPQEIIWSDMYLEHTNLIIGKSCTKSNGEIHKISVFSVKKSVFTMLDGYGRIEQKKKKGAGR